MIKTPLTPAPQTMTLAEQINALEAKRTYARQAGLSDDIARLTRQLDRLHAQAWEGVGTN